MKVGVLLPTFRRQTDDALAAADRAAAAGLDGVFAYDHLYPMGRPDRPALSPLPLLAAVSRRQTSLVVGPLVARIGIVPTEVLVAGLRSLYRISGGRLIAALGTGDQLSEEENRTYGIAYDSAAARRQQLADALGELSGVDCWVGGGSVATEQIARSHGATVNLWNRSAQLIAAAAQYGPTSWAGDPLDDLDGQLSALDAAGATWAVFAPHSDVEALGRWREDHSSPQ